MKDVQAGFRIGRGTRDQIANIHWIIEKTRSSRKTSISALLTIPKPLTVYIAINLKILQTRLQQFMNHELPDVQVGFRKGRGTRDQIANIKLPIPGSWKKQESSRKTSISAFLTMPKPLTVWTTTN